MLGEWRDRVSAENERVSANLLKEGTKAEQRAARESELAAKQSALPDKRYGVIYADPEWKFEVYSERGMDRAADNHYPTSSTEDIMARVTDVVPHVGHDLSGWFKALVAIHAAPRWLWPALVEKWSNNLSIGALFLLRANASQ